jgi:hypothetical protein
LITQAIVKEFNHEMTFRGFDKVSKGEMDSLTEHSFLVSNRDFDINANDSMNIAAFAYDERKSIMQINFVNEKKESNILKSPFAISQNISQQRKSDQFEIQLKNMEVDDSDLQNAEKLKFRLSAHAFDDYVKNNDINEIKF